MKDSSRWYIRPLVIVLSWMVFGVEMASQYYLYQVRAGLPASWSQLLVQELFYALLWAALTPLVLWLAKRYPIESRTWHRRLPLHLLLSVIVSSFHHILFDLLRAVGGLSGPFSLHWDDLVQGLLRFVDYGILLYWIILLIHYALENYRKYHERALRASQLEAQLAQAELQVLKMQLQPHFLFNTLNAISVLIRKDPDAATEMVGRVSSLLRFILEHSGAQEVALKTEMEFLDRYLQIEKTRFGDRLSVRFSIDPAVLDGRVPNMMLQPLVENAIKHGISKRRGAGLIEISAARDNGNLRLEIRDNGIGLPADSGIQEGVGLANTRARLHQLYGDRHVFRLSNNEAQGTVASLEIPFLPFDKEAR